MQSNTWSKLEPGIGMAKTRSLCLLLANKSFSTKRRIVTEGEMYPDYASFFFLWRSMLIATWTLFLRTILRLICRFPLEKEQRNERDCHNIYAIINLLISFGQEECICILMMCVVWDRSMFPLLIPHHFGFSVWWWYQRGKKAQKTGLGGKKRDQKACSVLPILLKPLTRWVFFPPTGSLEMQMMRDE